MIAWPEVISVAPVPIDAPSSATNSPKAGPAPDFTERAEKSRSAARTVAMAVESCDAVYVGAPGCAHAAGAVAGASAPPAEMSQATSFQLLDSRRQKERY